MLGASFDDVEKNRAFADKFGYPFRLLCDRTQAVGTAYGVLDADDPGYPRRVSFLIGPDGRIVTIYDPVEPATHAAQVLAEVAAPGR